ncbi:P-loop NTPase fold protein [Actinophytocola glycyrrhizae]|uniref:P-loop NTPase fold protein n=1 Tax=Actinophytocola glycyrrhizae TaxID=2044873 RepID=A0ABV9RUK6_9PSEU
MDKDRVVRLWSAASARPEPVELTGHSGDVLRIALSPDGTQVAAGDLAGHIWVWQRRHPAVASQLVGHGAPITALAITPDNARLVSGAEDGTVQLWELASSAPIDVRKPLQPRPGVLSDRESTADLLGFRADVDGIATLIADRQTELPLAIALLGRWGSGKSSFVRQLQDRVARLADQSRGNPARRVFANAVRQVRFNAWHYADDQLWTGLLDHLFAELARPETPPDSEQARAERDFLRTRVRNLDELNGKPAGVGRLLLLPKVLWSASAPVCLLAGPCPRAGATTRARRCHRHHRAARRQHGAHRARRHLDRAHGRHPGVLARPRRLAGGARVHGQAQERAGGRPA